MRPQFKKKELEIETIIEPGLEIMTADRRKCKQIMLNLLSNAYKYTPRKGKILVEITSVEGAVKISVSDTGIGIDKEDQEKIFKEFHQTNQARDEGLGGTGIGLSLTRRLVEIHGGEIGVKSSLGKGTTFWFSLPLKTLKKEVKKVSEIMVETEVTGLTGRKILVAEDNETNLSMILDMLSVCGHVVIVARNGKEAIELALSNQPDLILMDIRMPIMDGLEATRRLRSLPQFKDIPIIALTASVGESTRDKCVEAGCTEHLSKPIQSSILFKTLRHYFSASLAG
jgi:CheY-like chemotaxis protein